MSISIFDYDDYRSFLQDLVVERKKTQPHFSHRFFAREAGFSSSGYLKLVMGGKRNLSLEGMGRFAKALKLNKQEREYFQNLVLLNQAKNKREQLERLENLVASRRFGELKAIEKCQFQFYSHWYYSAIRELVVMDDFVEDADWIARRLSPPITAAAARRGLRILLKLGLLKRDETGRLIQANVSITSGSEVRSLALTKFHQQMIDRARASILTVDHLEREIGSVTLALTERQIPQLKEMIHEFRHKILSLDTGRRPDVDRIYQFNVQLFPLTKTKGVAS